MNHTITDTLYGNRQGNAYYVASQKGLGSGSGIQSLNTALPNVKCLHIRDGSPLINSQRSRQQSENSVLEEKQWTEPKNQDGGGYVVMTESLTGVSK